MDKKALFKKVAEITLVGLLSVLGIYVLADRYYDARTIPSAEDTFSSMEPVTLEFADGRLVATTSEPLTSGVVIPATTDIPPLVYAPKILVAEGTYFKKKLHGFSYTDHGPQMLEIAGKCVDAYYAVLIFSVSDDYTKNPSSAKYNQAQVCPKTKTFDRLIDLSSINLSDGKYYFFVADQGVNTPWYNPR